MTLRQGLTRREPDLGRARVFEANRVARAVAARPRHRVAFQMLRFTTAGESHGSPIAMLIRNRDWANWQEIMDAAPREGEAGLRKRAVTRPRPGHAALTGVLKYDRDDARDILERASARETTARVAAAAVCKRLLAEFDVRLGSHLVHLGGIDATAVTLPHDLNAAADASPLRTLDRDAEARMVTLIDETKRAGNTLGGI